GRRRGMARRRCPAMPNTTPTTNAPATPPLPHSLGELEHARAFQPADPHHAHDGEAERPFGIAYPVGRALSPVPNVAWFARRANRKASPRESRKVPGLV